MKRKKKGSTLITIVIVASLVLTVGAAMLTMTLGDYRMRINESDRIQNLYGSESGLDGAYNIIVKTFDGATRYGALKVEVLKNAEVDFDEDKNEYDFKSNELLKYFSYETKKDYLDCLTEIRKIREDDTEKQKTRKIQEEKEKIDNILNDEFKRSFKNFIYSNDNSTVDNFSILPVLIWNQGYVKVDKGDLFNNIINKLTNLNNNIEKVNLGTNPITYIPLMKKDIEKYQKKDDNDEIIFDSDINAGLDDESDSKIQLNGDIYTITVRSVFETDTDKILDKNIGKNTKKVETVYNMKVPEYKDVTFSESNANTVNIPELNNNKVMIVGQNMNIRNSNELNINGDVYVCGIDDDNGGIVYSKYNGGISIDGSNSVNFNGKVITPRTVNLKDKTNVNLKGNLYCKNLYIGKGTDKSEDSNINIQRNNNVKSGQAVIDNDITLKAINSSITMNDFYGISDKEQEDKSDTGLKNSSSSIIVNGNEDSSIKISDNAYIMGVANIATGSENEDRYQTGESTAVKGNYIAYANVVNTDDKFKYYDPLQLLDEDNINNKSKHFVDYWENKITKDNVGGIELPENTHSVGAIVYKDNENKYRVKNKTIDAGTPDEISQKRKEYAQYVYTVKDIVNNTYEPFKKIDNIVNNIFVIPSDSDSHSTWNIYNNNILSESNNKEKAIFSKGKIIIAKGEVCSITKDSDDIEIKTGTDGELNAVIVAEGDVTIQGDIDFKGIIITKGNLNINSSSKFKYDKNLIQRIQAANSDLFEAVFNYTGDIIDNSVNSSSEEIIINYDLSKFLKTESWKIIKDEKGESNV